MDDAYVACISLGYTGNSISMIHFNNNVVQYCHMYLTDPVAYTNLHLSNSPIVWNYVNCEHWNTDIYHCTRTVIPDDVLSYYYSFCTSTIVAGIRCAEGIKINQSKSMYNIMPAA